jgi:hypothetical protein
MLEKTTCKKICQKGPPAGGGTFGQAAWANAGMGVPPSPNPARRLAGTTVGHAALAIAGRCYSCKYVPFLVMLVSFPV